MNTRAIRSGLIGSLGVALALASGSALATTFRLTDLGTLGGFFSVGSDTNESGQVTGSSNTAGGENHAFLWNGTRMQNLGTLFGTAINDTGQVTGARLANGVYHAFLWTAPRCGTSARGGRFSLGLAINASGQVTGFACRPDGLTCHALLWDGTTLQDLNALIHPALMNAGASHMNHAYPKSYFDRMGLVSLVDTCRRFPCVS